MICLRLKLLCPTFMNLFSHQQQFQYEKYCIVKNHMNKISNNYTLIINLSAKYCTHWKHDKQNQNIINNVIRHRNIFFLQKFYKKRKGKHLLTEEDSLLEICKRIRISIKALLRSKWKSSSDMSKIKCDHLLKRGDGNTAQCSVIN
jgi:hypothetical protein